MSTKFFTNQDGNTLINKLSGIFQHNPIAYFDVLVGYFYASGYFALRPHLDEVGQIRILVGMDADELTRKSYGQALQAKASSEEVGEKFLSFLAQDWNRAPYNKQTEDGIKQFITDVVSGKVVVKAHPLRKLHAKVYIFRPENFNEHNSGSVITGSSNLTSQGLGAKEQSSNYEFNVLLNDYSDVRFAADEFEKLWEEAVPLPTDIFEKARKLTFLEEITPHQLYIKFLLEYFGDVEDQDIGRDWPDEFDRLSYQEDAVKEAFTKLEKYNGLFLSDVVGLGKTVVGSAIAWSYWKKHSHDCSILVVSPPALKGVWQDKMEKFFRKRGGIEYKTPGELPQIVDKAVYYDLIIVDEAHKFRNNTTIQYENLQKICKSRTTTNKKKKVILITATPFNNRPKDLFNQATLFLDGKDASFLSKPLDQYCREIEKKHKSLLKSGRSNLLQRTQDLYSELRTEFVEKITIRRTRTDLQQIARYRNDLEARGISFPETKLKKIYYSLPEEMELLYDETIDIISGRNQKGSSLLYMRYQILSHLQEQVKQKYKTAEVSSQQLVGIMKTLLLKRMDSSFEAFLSTLETFIASTEAMIKMIDKNRIYIAPDKNLMRRILDEDDEAMVEILDAKDKKCEVVTAEDLSHEFIDGVRADHETLTNMYDRWKKVLVLGDPKFDAFYKRLQRDVMSKYSPADGKVIVFTESAVTKDYVTEEMQGKGIKVLDVDSKNRKSKGRAMVDNFDANAEHKRDDYQVLITTDVLAEGVDLHRSNTVVNYDTPWNATKLMQRIGRVNRIGTKAEFIHVYNCFPTAKIENDLELENKAKIKLWAFHTALGEDSQIYSDEEQVETFGIFDQNVAEEASPILQYREDLRDFKASKPEEYEYILNLGPKLRTGRENKKQQSKTLVFARTEDLQSSKFYLIGPDAKTRKELDFPASAEMLKADDAERGVPVHSSHYDHIEAALAMFSDQQAERVTNFYRGRELIAQDSKIVKHLEAILDAEKDNEEHSNLIQKAIALIKSRRLAHFRRKIQDALEHAARKAEAERINPEEYKRDELMDLIRQELPSSVVEEENVEDIDVAPRILLSQSYS